MQWHLVLRAIHRQTALAFPARRDYLAVNPDIVKQRRGWRRKGPAQHRFATLVG
jgi:hypothetical protein